MKNGKVEHCSTVIKRMIHLLRTQYTIQVYLYFVDIYLAVTHFLAMHLVLIQYHNIYAAFTLCCSLLYFSIYAIEGQEEIRQVGT